MNNLQVYMGSDTSFESPSLDIFGDEGKHYNDGTFTCVNADNVEPAKVWVLRTGSVPGYDGYFSLKLLEFRLYSSMSLVEYA